MIKLLLITLFISGLAFGQAKKDSIEIRRQASNKNDSLLIIAVMSDIKTVLYGKIQVNYYDFLDPIFREYLKQKSLQWHTKPK